MDHAVVSNATVKHLEQVAAVHGMRGAELGPGRQASPRVGDDGDLLNRFAGDLAQRVPQADHFECLAGERVHADAGADLSQLGLALEHGDLNTARAHRHRGGQAADPAADDQNPVCRWALGLP